MSHEVTIRHLSGGYILETDSDQTIIVSLDEVFRKLLLFFEGRARTFTGESYGDVVIARKPTETESPSSFVIISNIPSDYLKRLDEATQAEIAELIRRNTK